MYYSTVILLSILYLIITIEDPGRANPKYKIKDYFGSRHLTTNLAQTFFDDEPVIILWSNGQFLHKKSSDILFIANPTKHTINSIQEETMHIIIGEMYESGYRDGDAENARINTPRALVIYNETSFPNNNEIKYKPFLFSENSINIDMCINANIHNYTPCLNTTHNLENLAKNNDTTEINPSNVKMININSENLEESNEENIFIFVSDSKNHCIRKINLVNSDVTTFAGICTEKGFKDGPYGINKFNEPQGIGIDSYGNIYVYDSGNRYMRYISPDGYVHTLIHGACLEYNLGEVVKNKYNYQNTQLLCFRKWIKNSGEPSEHIYTSNNENYCFDNIVNCPNYLSEQKKK